MENKTGFTYLKTISIEESVVAEDINRNAAKRERERESYFSQTTETL